MRILVAEDDVRLAALLAESLAEAGWQVAVVHDGKAAYRELLAGSGYDVALLDWMLPGMDGVTVARRLRGLDLATPIMMLTARGDVRDRIDGLDAGADDYLPKPFDIPELQVRVRALLRRAGSVNQSSLPEILTAGEITLIPENLQAKVDDRIEKLTPTEFEILHCLMQHHGQTVSTGKLLEEVWGYSPDDDVDTIRVHIRHLRTRLEKGDRKYIKTVYGGGYQLVAEGFTKEKGAVD